MSTYRYFTAAPAYAKDGDVVVAELPLSEVRFTRVLSGSGQLQAKLNARHPLATPDYVQAGYHQLIVERNGEVVWCGPLWTVMATMGPDRGDLELGATEWFSYFLPLGSDTTQSIFADEGNSPPGLNGGFPPLDWPSEVDQFDIARACIQLGQADFPGQAPNAWQGIETPYDDLSGVTRALDPIDWFKYYSYGQVITDMAQKADGFDFTIECSWDTSDNLLKVRKVWTTDYPRRYGYARSGIVNGMPITKAQATYDATRMGSHIVVLGDDGSGGDPLVATADLRTSFWRRTQWRTWAIADQNTLESQVDAAAARYGRPVVLPTITLQNDEMSPVDYYRSFSLGDIVPVDLEDGYFQFHGDLRLVAIEVTPTGEGEMLAFTFNFPEELET